MSASEVAAVTSFQQTAPGGPILAADGNAPLNDTARYNLFPFAPIFGSGGVLGAKKPQSDIALVLADQAARYTSGDQPAYVMVTSAMIAYGQAYGTPTSYFTILLNSLARSKYWKLVTRTPDAVIYELPPKTFPKGFSENGPTPSFVVP
jgi:hypothetical protein